MLKNKTSIKRMKKQKISKQNDKKGPTLQTKCGCWYRNSYGKLFILNKKSYFTLSHSTISRNNNFYSRNVSQSPPSVKYRPHAKFEQKLIVFIWMFEKGISMQVFGESGYAVNLE